MIVCIAEKPSVGKNIAKVLAPRKTTVIIGKATAIRSLGLSAIFAN